MGEVWKAEDLKLSRQVALKFLASHLVSDPEIHKRFEREAKASAALNHPNICTVYEIDEAGGKSFLAMELVQGESLEARIEKGPLPLPDALDIARQIAEGLQEAHTAGVVHRDIKPGNLLITPDGRAKILDFGLALLTEGSKLTKLDTTVGTVAYMSPEQAEGAEVDHRTDIWALGCVLYEMVAGVRPFKGQYDQALLYEIVNQEPEPLTGIRSGVPMELEFIVGKCLAKDSADRYDHISELAKDLGSLGEKLKSGRSAVLPAATSTTARSSAEAAGKGFPALRRKLRLAWALCAVSSLVALVAVSSRYFAARPQSHSWRVLPLTAYPGEEESPALSWDGERVAFTWDGEEKGNTDVYVRLVEGGSPIRLTDDPAQDSLPTWSPSGRRIAFVRGKAVYVIPSLGGEERRLTSFDEQPGSLSWHPSKDVILTSIASGVQAIDISTGQVRPITSPEPPYSDGYVRVSHDGRMLTFVRGPNNFSQAIYSAEMDEDLILSSEKRLKDVFWCRGLAWLGDSERLVYSAREGSRQLLWSLDVRRAEAEVIGVDSDGAWRASVAPVTNQLVYSKRVETIDTWELAGPGPAGPPVEKYLTPRPLIVSSYSDFMAHFSADAGSIGFTSTRTGYQEIWRAKSDGTGAIRLTNLKAHTGSSHWSPDGTTIVFDLAQQGGKFNIFTLGADGGAPKRLTDDASNETAPSYTPDGAWVVFSSDRSGEGQIWKKPPGGGEAVQVTRSGGRTAVVSSDGSRVFYRNGSEIWQVPIDGGDETLVLTDPAGPLHHATAGDSLYYLREGVDRGPLRLSVLRLKSGETFDLWNLPSGKYFTGGNSMSVSPDESRIIFQLAEMTRMDLMLVEGLK